MEFKKLVYKSPVGCICCLFEGDFLVAVSIGKISYEAIPLSEKGGFEAELDAYFRGDLKKFRQKIKFVRGTDFEQKVWLALKGIPYGETRSYKWLAERIGKPEAARAVGQALKKNPLPIILPCHRVIASDGSLGGFSCGIEVKKWLLRHEGAI